jgi:hypothetical protein
LTSLSTGRGHGSCTLLMDSRSCNLRLFACWKADLQHKGKGSPCLNGEGYDPFFNRNNQMVSVKIDADRFLAALKATPQVVSREIRQEMRQALKDVQQDARTHHKFHTGHGKAEKSIMTETDPTGLQGRVYIDAGIAPHAVYQHEGTGLYGEKHKAFPVKAKNKKALHWVSEGDSHFSKSVSIKGIHPDPFLHNAMERQKPGLITRFRAALARAIQKAGL